MKRWVLAYGLIIALGMVILGTGCSDERDDETVAQLQACELLTLKEAMAIVGDQSLTKNEEMNTEGVTLCGYGSGSESFNIALRKHNSDGSPEEVLTQYEASANESLGMSGYSLERVVGIGSAAGWDKNSKQLFVINDRYMLIVTIAYINDTKSFTYAKAVAHKVLTKF